MTGARRRALMLGLLGLAAAGLLAGTEGGRTWLRVMRYEWIAGMPLVWSIPRQIVACPTQRSPALLVALSFGQSNAANAVRGRHTPDPRVLNFHEGRCFAGADPLPGATGTGGSVWSRLGDRLLDSRRFEQIVFAGIAVDSAEIARWQPGGDLHPRLLSTLHAMSAAGLEPTHLLWHQGERDRQLATPAADYIASFEAMLDAIRAAGISAPIYVAQATYCRGHDSAELRAAQLSLVDPARGVRAGPDTDTLRGPGLRHDDCHFSATGAARHAELWRDALLAAAP
jgi:hypothetical protein